MKLIDRFGSFTKHHILLAKNQVVGDARFGTKPGIAHFACWLVGQLASWPLGQMAR